MNTYGMALLMALAILLILYLVDRATGGNSLPMLGKGKPILTALTLLAKAVGAATNNPFFDQAYAAMSAAVDATERAEELWKNGHLDKEQREEYAAALIAQAMHDANIPVTDSLKRIIAGIISLTCMIMPHYSTPAPAEGEAE